MVSAGIMSADTEVATANIDKMARTMNRADLLRMLGLQFDAEVVGDFDKLYPVTLYAKSTLKVASWNVPFLNEGTAGECCVGASLVRWGHKTVTVKCFSAKLTTESTVCAHCDQLWSMPDDDGIYELDEGMTEAWDRYKKGVRRAMKNWDDMQDMDEFFGKEIQAVKDLLCDSEFELEAS